MRGNRGFGFTHGLAVAVGVLICLPCLPAGAAPAMGDLDGDGAVALSDFGLFLSLIGARQGGPNYHPEADFDADGAIGLSDFGRLMANFGATGDPDTSPPDLFVTLNDIPDDMNDVLVVPPDQFQITLQLDAQGGSLIDMASFSVKSSLDIGPYPAGTELVPLFQATPQRAVWEVPAASDLDRTTHSIDVRVRDRAGNESQEIYPFAVRDFTAGPPLGNLQVIFLDFDQDRSLGPDVDLLEDLREYGLSSTADPALETGMRDLVVAEVVSRVAAYYGAGGSDPVNIQFSSTDPGFPRTRLCVGGESAQGPPYLGAATLDKNNLIESSDECAVSGIFGVFPRAIDDLWGTDPGYHAAFDAVDPDEGGVPWGEHPLDPIIAAPGWDITTAPPNELGRALNIIRASDAFVQIVATAVAHEVGHTLGLTAPGPAPGGLFGGSSGATQDHNELPAGGTPSENFIMNQGASFSWDEITARNGSPMPTFRALNWAYLRDRIALDDDVTQLLPPVALDSLDPSVVIFDSGTGPNVQVTLHGQNFVDTPTIELLRQGDPTPDPIFSVVVLDPQTATGFVNKFFVTAGFYDVRFINGDGQENTLVDRLEVIFR